MKSSNLPHTSDTQSIADVMSMFSSTIKFTKRGFGFAISGSLGKDALGSPASPPFSCNTREKYNAHRSKNSTTHQNMHEEGRWRLKNITLRGIEIDVLVPSAHGGQGDSVCEDRRT